jgi:hypothetical protein
MFLGLSALWLLTCRLVATQACRSCGHIPSWVLGDACGFDRPVCTRCRNVL